MDDPFIWQRRVEFHETDAAGIVHFSTFFKWMEAAEHAYFRHLGIETGPTAPLAWPRVKATCDYQKPASFNDLITVQVSLTKLSEKSLTLGFAILAHREQLAHGTLTIVCARKAEGKLESVPIPLDTVIALKL